MGFFSNLFKRKYKKLTQEQVDDIEEKVEKSEEKHSDDSSLLSDLSKPVETK